MLTPDKQALFVAMYAEGQGLYEIKIPRPTLCAFCESAPPRILQRRAR